jgi:hypothetical protein
MWPFKKKGLREPAKQSHADKHASVSSNECEHSWNGCVCSKCGVKRDEQHDFAGNPPSFSCRDCVYAVNSVDNQSVGCYGTDEDDRSNCQASTFICTRCGATSKRESVFWWT